MAAQKVSVVTGGAGFLGSHLTDRLLAEGHRVVAIDNLITGNPKNIAHLGGNENYRFIKSNVSNYILVEETVDYVFHFASPASPIDYLELPIPTLKVGALGTHNALGLAKAKKATFLLASTSECYGDPLVHPQTEDYWGNVNPIGPRGVYDEAKRFAEAMTMAYHRYHGIDTKIVRIFNTYGPRMRLRDGRVVPAFIGQALSGTPLTIFGDGSQTRSFCYVSDLIDGIFRRFPRAGEHRESARDDDQAVRRRDHPDHGNEIADREQTASRGRSESAPARYHPGAEGSRLGTEGRVRRRNREDDRVLQGLPGAR
jgi:dTDP-glucose 4,6-dehydratase